MRSDASNFNTTCKRMLFVQFSGRFVEKRVMRLTKTNVSVSSSKNLAGECRKTRHVKVYLRHVDFILAMKREFNLRIIR